MRKNDFNEKAFLEEFRQSFEEELIKNLSESETEDNFNEEAFFEEFSQLLNETIMKNCPESIIKIIESEEIENE